MSYLEKRRVTYLLLGLLLVIGLAGQIIAQTTRTVIPYTARNSDTTLVCLQNPNGTCQLIIGVGYMVPPYCSTSQTFLDSAPAGAECFSTSLSRKVFKNGSGVWQ
jgi:hypothetical protein